MKKNLISVLILALVAANLILTAVLTISILPQTKQANELITKVCAAIDLGLESGEDDEAPAVSMDKVEEYAVKSGETMTINLKKGDDGKDSFAVMAVTLGVNTEADDYKTYGTAEKLLAKDGMIQGQISTVISNHTIDELRDNQKEIQDELLKSLRKMYDSDFIISVSFTATYQSL